MFARAARSTIREGRGPLPASAGREAGANQRSCGSRPSGCVCCREAAVPEQTPSGDTRVRALLADSGAGAASGQLDKATFMAELRERLVDECNAELASVGRRADDCPYLDRWLTYYEGRSAAQLERAVQVYTGTRPGDAAALTDAVSSRVRAAVRIWIGTGRVTGIPAQASVSAAGQPDPVWLRVQLGQGAPLPSVTRARMERGLGQELGHVRLHTGDTAARLATSVGARAFAVGENVAFGAGEYRPGTLEGELLLAHELAHTIQQGAGSMAAGAGPPGALEPNSFDENPLEHVADVAAVRAVASLRGVQVPGLPASTLAPGRAGLRLQGCRDKVQLDPVAIGPIPDYDKFTTPDGKIIDTEESAAAIASMVQNPDQLDRVWSDAQGGDARAKAVIDRLTPEWINVGVVTAEREARLQCLTPPTQVLNELVDDESCFTDWSALDPIFHADRPGGAHVRELIALGYSQRARKLQIRNNIIVSSLNLLLAGWTVKAALAGEARALGAVEPAPSVPPRPKARAIPEELKGLKTKEIVKELKLPNLDEVLGPGYHWRKTKSGNVVVSRNPGRGDLPKVVYDPATGTFPLASKFARPTPTLVKASLMPEAELEASAKQAIAARDAIAGVPEGKTGARSPSGDQTISGWGKDKASLDDVRDLSNKIDHEIVPNRDLDGNGGAGAYNMSHAEKKLAAKTDGPIGVSRPMCLDCQFFFAKLAKHRGKPVLVADPTGVRIFRPDGAVISGENAAALVAAQAAGNVDIEEALDE
jgi:hypothetical protein